jgi:hypothetical protein
MSSCTEFRALFCIIISTISFDARNSFRANAEKNFCARDGRIDGKSIRLFGFRLRGGLADKNVPSAIDDLAVHAETPFYPSVFDEDDLESDERYTIATANRVMDKGSTESEEDDEDKGVFLS